MPYFNTFIVFIDATFSSFEESFFTNLIKMGPEVFTTLEPQSVFFHKS